VFLAQYPVHSSVTLGLMEEALKTFHENKHVFTTLGIRDHFNIPKLHFASHYVRCIKLFGTTDNFNTEYTERLHIDLAKDAYRATNRKEELPQMVNWLERKEKMARHSQFIEGRLQLSRELHSQSGPTRTFPLVPGLDRRRFLKMAKHPSQRKVPFETIQSITGYGATHFLAALTRFIAICNNPGISRRQLDVQANSIFVPSRFFPL
jgi:hypothetical protein